MTELMVRRGRGRPPRSHSDGHVTRSVIVRRGTEMMTETGFFSTSIDQLLTTAGIPKGSFYHYFSSWPAYTRELISYWVQDRTIRLAQAFSVVIVRVGDAADLSTP